MKKMRSGFSLFLSMVLVLGMLPVQGYAQDCTHQLTYAAEGDSIIVESCANEGCEHRETATLELDSEASLAYTGKEVKPLRVTYSDGWQGEKPEISYVNNIDVTPEPTEAPEEEPETLEQMPAEVPAAEQPAEETEPVTEEQAATEETAPKEEPEEEKEAEKKEIPIPAGTLTIGDVSVTRTFKVEKATLTVTATASVSYGDDAPVYAPKYEGLAEGDKLEDVLSGEVNMTSTYAKDANAGDPFEILVNAEGVKLKAEDKYVLATKNGTGTVAVRKLTLRLDSTEYTYDGQEHTPKVVVEGLVGEDKVEADYEPVTVKNVGTYKILIKGLKGEEAVLEKYEAIPEGTELPFAVKPRTVEISWDKLEFEYDGEAHLPTPTITGVVEGDEVTLDWEPKEGKTAAGTYDITIVGLNGADAGNYTWTENTETSFTISLPAQEKPDGVTPVAETIRGKSDGKITGVDSTMEYKNKTAGEDVKYTAITGTEVTGLAAGTYLVRKAATDAYDVSEAVEVAIEKGNPVQITLPAEQIGYTLTLTPDETEVEWQDTVTVKFELGDRYTRGVEDFAVKVNGEKIKLDSKGAYTFAVSELEKDEVLTNITITVEGVYPLVAIKFRDTTFTDVVKDVTFDDYLNQDQTLEIETPLDAEIYYAEVDAKVENLSTITEWTPYPDTEMVTVSATDRKAVFYAKVTAGNDVYYASTNGVVFDTTAPVVGIKSGVYYTTQKVKISDSNLKEVIVEGISTTPQTFTAQNGAKEIVVTLKGNVDASYKIVAKDKAGNTTGESSVIRVNMDPIEKLTTTKAGLDKVDTLLNDANATTAEKAALNEIKTNKAAYLVILQIQALPEAKNVQPYNETHRDAYDAAQKAYDALSDTQKKNIVGDDNKKILDDVKDALAYEIITDEDDLQWEKKSQVDFVLKVNGPDARFKELQIAGKVVADTKYTHKEDTYGTKITIDDAYLDTLTTGKKTIKVVYTDGATDGEDQLEIVKAGTNPKTGDDGIRFWMTASVLSLACLAAVACCGRKRKFQA